MLRLQRASSVERSSSSSSSSSSISRPKLGVWWSLAPRRLYKCSYCSLRFDSLKALGGHQNAHRQQRNEMQRLVNVPPQNDHRPMAATAPPPNGQEIDLELRLRCGPPIPNEKTFYEFLPLKKEGHGLYGYGASGSRAPSRGVGNKPTYRHTHASKYHPYVTPAPATAPAAYNGERRRQTSRVHSQRRELPLMNTGGNACDGRFLGLSLSGQNGGRGGGGFLEASASSGANEGLVLFPGILEVDNTAGGASMDELDLTLKL